MESLAARALLLASIAAPLAAQTDLGSGCGSPSPTLSLNGAASIPSPDFGVDVQSSPNAGVLLCIGIGSTNLTLGRGCPVYLDPATAVIHASLTTDPLGQARAAFPIPNWPSLVGLPVSWQALQWQDGGPFLNLGNLSNGITAQLTLTPNFPRLVFSRNTASAMSTAEWNVLTGYADLVSGLDEHGYTFPGLLDDFRAAAPDTPAYTFFTSMGLQRSSLHDWRFRYLDQYEDAFLHVSDPASLKVVVIDGVTRLFWARDYRRVSGDLYQNPLGVTSYLVESAASKTGPWTTEGAAIAGDPSSFRYEASVATTDTSRWYRIRTRLTATGSYTDYSWPTQPDTAAAGFAYLEYGAGPTFTAGVWGTGPALASGITFEWGKQAGWGYPNATTTKGTTVNGITEYSGPLSSWPSSGAWAVRLRSAAPTFTSMLFDSSRRNNRLISKFGERMFKPDHANVLAMHRSRLLSADALGLTGARLDFVIDSWPSWYVAMPPQGEDASWFAIEPRMLTMLNYLKTEVPDLELILNGISVTASWSGIFDYTPPASGVDCEYLGYSYPGQSAPFREYEMLDGVIAAAHQRDLTVTCYSHSDETDVDARMTSLARYWLVFRPKVYYQYMTHEYHLNIDYFPEYDVDLGWPVVQRLNSRSDLVYGSIYRRDFHKGIALYNPQTYAVSVPLGDSYYRVTPQGGHSPKLGGSGSCAFPGPYTSITLAAKQGAILVRSPGLSR